MRLGVYTCKLKAGNAGGGACMAKSRKWKNATGIVMNLIRSIAVRSNRMGSKVSGEYAEKHLAEIVELPTHPFFMGVQFHPEFKSRPLRPHPLFRGFIAAALEKKQASRQSAIFPVPPAPVAV